ncbi:hypothetical protein BDV39DRAFT_174900 [Aspergillus sergii]|uniref:Xylanolytic transcriptional activator regulatory domain-containing protein n=1 Tax=Aspergillus sergii TaxID=1034303 RepID=A0A5N6X564_9EURO|nr:hypothetical protein BDV39DRAFT_174900 [Aspergillus sergii]
MRPLSSYKWCRQRKSKCVVPRRGNSCIRCSEKGLACDLAELASVKVPSPLPPLPASVPSSSRCEQNEQNSCSVSNLDSLPSTVCNKLVDLYFNLIEGKQLQLFHPHTFISMQRAGQAPSYLVFAMIALMARFSSDPFFQNTHPWRRAVTWLKKAIQSFNNREQLVNISSLQGCILLAFVAFVEGDSDQEALLTSQAICMVQRLDLPSKLSSNPIERELGIRLFWACWGLDTWHSARTLVPRQLTASGTMKRPLEEETFLKMRADDPDERYCEAMIDSLSLRRCSLWNYRLALTEIHGQVMQLNDDLSQRSPNEAEIRDRVRRISGHLDRWLHDLPDNFQHTPENMIRHSERGFGREFAMQQMIYHHQSQLLYYQFLHKTTMVEDAVIDNESLMYAARCKAHAAALSKVMWDMNSIPGRECLWSPVNGHLLVVSSSILLYILLSDTDDQIVSGTRQLLEQNFTMLLELRKYWSQVELSMIRSKVFHQACQISGTSENFKMDSWLIQFLNRYDVQVPNRYEEPDIDLMTDKHFAPCELW